MYTKDRHTHLLSSYSKQRSIEKKEKLMLRNGQTVDTYGHGTTGYMVKHGPNAGKIIKHIKVDSKNI